MRGVSSFLKGQFNFLADAITKPSMGKFAGGASQLKFEQTADFLYDDIAGPALKMAARAAPFIGLGIGATMLFNHNQDMGANTGNMAGGAIAGGLAGGIGASMLASKYIDIAGTTAHLQKNPALAKLAMKNPAVLKFGLGLGGAALGMIGGAAVGALGGQLGATTALGPAAGFAMGAAGLGIGMGAMALGIDPTLPIRAGIKAIGGTGGALGAAVGIARGAATIGYQGLQGAERIARTVLTGSPVHSAQGKGAKTMLDAYFPNFRNMAPIDVKYDQTDLFTARRLMSRGMAQTETTYAHTDLSKARRLMGQGVSPQDAAKQAFSKGGTRVVPSAKAAEHAFLKGGSKIHDPRRFAPNPRIARRITGAAALFAVGSAVHEAMAPKIAPPTMFFDGVSMRHTNDMGAGGEYGMGMLGANSSLNMDYGTAGRMLAAAF
jgi:hypothetical protein